MEWLLHRPLILPLVVAIVGHGLLMSSDVVHAKLAGAHVQVEVGSESLIHLATTVDARDVHLASLGSAVVEHPDDEVCDPMTPWQPINSGRDAKRVPAISPIDLVPATILIAYPPATSPMPQYPPGVRRALLQVYLN